MELYILWLLIVGIIYMLVVIILLLVAQQRVTELQNGTGHPGKPYQ